MRVEVSIAVNFVLSFLYNRLPRRRVNLIGECLQSILTAKFQGHWYPDQPLKGTAYRSLKISGQDSDPIIADAARETGLDAMEVTGHLPQNLTLWIDPGEVSCRVGEKGPVTQLYSADIPEHQQQLFELPHQLGDQPQAAESQSEQHELPHHPESSIGSSYTTAAAFAQTKFGSTKLRQPPRLRQPQQRHRQQYMYNARSQQQQQQQQQFQNCTHQEADNQYPHAFGSKQWSCMYNSYGGWMPDFGTSCLSVAIPSAAMLTQGHSLLQPSSGSGYGSGGSCHSSGHSSPLMMSK